MKVIICEWKFECILEYDCMIRPNQDKLWEYNCKAFELGIDPVTKFTAKTPEDSTVNIGSVD